MTLPKEEIMPITTSMMATVRLADEVTLAAWWDGGREIGIHIDAGDSRRLRPPLVRLE